MGIVISSPRAVQLAGWSPWHPPDSDSPGRDQVGNPRNLDQIIKCYGIYSLWIQVPSQEVFGV